EIERVLDFVGDAGGELAEGSELFGLDQAILRGAQVIEGLRQFLRAHAQLIKQSGVLDGDHRLIGEIRDKLNLLFAEWAHFLAVDDNDANQLALPEHRYGKQGPSPHALGGDDAQRG